MFREIHFKKEFRRIKFRFPKTKFRKNQNERSQMQKQVERSFFFTLYIERAYSSPQILMVLSDELLIIFVPSGLYDTE